MPLTISPPSVATVIKHRTQLRHEEVEQILVPKLNYIRSLDDYAGVLKMFYGYFKPVEALIQKFITPEVLPDIDRRRNSSFIINDLSFLGSNVSFLELTENLPAINSEEKAFGALYVLEGSTLGGKMITKMLAKNRQAAIPTEALHFFNGYGNETGIMWTNFLHALNQQNNVEEIIEAANETFSHLKTWMLQALCYETTN